ncbi:hypothetical protein VNO77_24117 [Canavalia gladiata]|uniref:Uncharacterized protein n=1 Tax=Canavalia gladiata TaxID=3824 RepID=A0AAN9L5N2_CANGL
MFPQNFKTSVTISWMMDCSLQENLTGKQRTFWSTKYKLIFQEGLFPPSNEAYTAQHMQRGVYKGKKSGV